MVEGDERNMKVTHPDDFARAESLDAGTRDKMGIIATPVPADDDFVPFFRSNPDLHATLLNQLGIDHRRLSYVHSGRAERLTDPEVTAGHSITWDSVSDITGMRLDFWLHAAVMAFNDIG